MIYQYTGIDSDYVILGLLVLLIALLTITIIVLVKLCNLKKNYRIFMSGKNAKSLEDTLLLRIYQVDTLIESNANNEREIRRINKKLDSCYCKMGMVKYDAFQEMGGKLSFSLALLDDNEDGFIINAVHSREGCYTYVKDVIGGNAVIVLSEEENEALDIALNSPTKKATTTNA